jgi:hypothetical protein
MRAAMQARLLGRAEERGLIHWRYGAVDGSYPPGKGGGEGIAYGRKGKGILIHSLTDGAGMPLATRTTLANGQVIPLLDALPVRIGKRGRPHKRFKVLAADKGYEANDLRQCLRNRGIHLQFPTRVWKTRKAHGQPIKKDIPRFQAEWTFARFQRKYRRAVVRWECLAVCFNAFLAIAMMSMGVHRFIVG